MKITSLCVYCGSSPGNGPEYLEAARSLGQTLAEKGITLVYGGGNVGLMGALADSTLEAGGEVVGVIPDSLIAKEVGHTGLTKLHRVQSMHERKMKMAELADAFVALPGGVGTLEEIFEVFTWTQLGFHAKPCAFMNVEGYFDPLFQFLERMSEERFIKDEHLKLLLRTSNPESLLATLGDHTPTIIDKWMDREKT